MKVIIGSPIYMREWILPEWFKAIENQDWPLSDLGFVFELGPKDEKTHKLLYEWHAAHPEVFCFDTKIREDQKHEKHPDTHHPWTKTKYHKMVALRNGLLERVRCYEPDRYFSLDSDILLEDPKTISTLVSLTEHYDAVGTLSYMTPRDTNYPSAMTWVREHDGYLFGRRANYPIGELFKADVIMASKMMSKPVYEDVNYMWHPKGEDLGWSMRCQDKGYELYCASYLYTPHIMHKWMLPEYRFGGDPRKPKSLGKTNISCV